METSHRAGWFEAQDAKAFLLDVEIVETDRGISQTWLDSVKLDAKAFLLDEEYKDRRWNLLELAGWCSEAGYKGFPIREQRLMEESLKAGQGPQIIAVVHN